MHIGIICEHSDPERGGAERYLLDLRRRLGEHGHCVSVRARTGPDAAPVAAWPAWRRPPAYARTFLPALRDAGAERILATVPVPGCDFYQPHHGAYGVSIPAHLDPLLWGWRHVRRYNPTRQFHFARLRAFERRVARSATVLALSPQVRDDFARAYPGCRSLLLRPGVDLERFSPAARSSGGAPALLFAAHNFRLKGLPAALRALRLLPDAQLIVAGDDRLPPLDADLSSRVKHRRPSASSSPFDMAELYRAADVLVHPTWYDTASLVVLEALAAGVVPITTRRDGNADLAVEGGGAALDDPRDARALADAVRATLADHDPARARAVAERFEAASMLDRVVEALTCAS